MKPIIAITADALDEPSKIMSRNFAPYISRNLKEAVLQCGAWPIILPFPDERNYDNDFAKDLLSKVDGIIIPGGFDIDPTLYGEEQIPEIGKTNYLRDAFEIAIVKAATAINKPILGICRGAQIINVALGGSLYQDLKAQRPETTIKHFQSSYNAYPTHHITIEKESFLTDIFGEKAYINSSHHQAIKKVAAPLKVVAQSPDGVVEAVENGNIWGVQWHPENMWMTNSQELALFQKFVDLTK